MKTIQLKRSLALAAGLTLSAPAGAGTIVHYHLDGLDAGTRGTPSTTFVNAANPGTHDGRAVAYVLGADGTTITEATEQPSLFPRGAEGLPEGLRHLDPVSGALHDAVRAVAFEGAAADARVSGGGIQADAVPVTGNFTVEAFCRAADWHAGQPDAAAVVNEQSVFGLMTGMETQAFECRLTPGKRLAFISCCEKYNWKKRTVEVPVMDGKWHHVAYSYRSKTRDLLGYFDYALVYSNRLDETEVLVGSQSATLYLGVNPKAPKAAALTGSLTEFRLSDEALEPASFLRAVRGDGEAFVWLSAGPADGNPPNGIFVDRPCAQYTVSDDVDGAVVYDGLLGTGVTGRKSYHFDAGDRATGQSGGFIVFDELQSFSAQSFTAEIGFKFAPGAWKDFPEDPAVLMAQNYQWYVFCDKRGAIFVNDGASSRVASFGATAWDDGAWHRLAVASDRANGETRVYLDGRLVGRRDGVLGDLAGKVGELSRRRIYVNSAPYDQFATNNTCRAGFFNDIRFTRRALRPCELLTTRHVAGDTLAWASFDRADAWEAECVEPSAWTGAATFVRTKAGVVSDADGNPLRERNGGSLSLASGGLTASRLSLLERTDQTVELFLMGIADAGTDLVSFTGFRGGTANRTAHAVWSLRATAEGLKVYVGDAAVAPAGALPSAAWSHVAVAFAPSADGSETAVTVYRDHAVAGTGTFAGTLAIDGLSDSSLALGAFAGQVDELRVSRGALGPSRLLRAVRRGLVLTIR